MKREKNGGSDKKPRKCRCRIHLSANNSNVVGHNVDEDDCDGNKKYPSSNNEMNSTRCEFVEEISY